MKNFIVKGYLYNELSEKEKKYIRDHNRMRYIDNSDPEWDWYSLDYIKDEIFKPHGFDIEISDIKYSGFSNQGDGLSFICNSHQLNWDLLFKHLPKTQECFEVNDYKNIKMITIFRNSFEYFHEHSVTLDILCKNSDFFKEKYNILYEELENLRIDLCKEAYNELLDHYNYLQSDEYLDELFSNDDYTHYTKNGKMIEEQ